VVLRNVSGSQEGDLRIQPAKAGSLMACDGAVLRRSDGVQLLGVTRDIAEHKHAEAGLRDVGTLA
jgi:hypothetical protein